MSKKKVNRKPPSRIKYDENHPVICFRATPAMVARLQEVKRSSGVSNADVIMAGLGMFEVVMRDEEELLRQGRKEGIEMGRKLYGISPRCTICWEPMVITSPDWRKLAAQSLEDRGIVHADCLKKRQMGVNSAEDDDYE